MDGISLARLSCSRFGSGTQHFGGNLAVTEALLTVFSGERKDRRGRGEYYSPAAGSRSRTVRGRRSAGDDIDAEVLQKLVAENIALGVTSAVPRNCSPLSPWRVNALRSEMPTRQRFANSLGTFAAVFRCHGASSPDTRFAFFPFRLGKVSLSRVCHPQTSPVPPHNSAPAFLLGRTQRFAAPHAPIAFQ
jgi:hypothetical protein